MNQFQHALNDGDEQTVLRMLRENPELLEKPGDHGFRPLMRAVSGTDRALGCVKALLDAGADVNAKTPEGYTALYCAIDVDAPTGGGNTPGGFILLLVQAGADLEARQHWGWTPLMRAVLEGSVEEVQALLAAGANPNVVFPQDTLPAFMRGRTLLMRALSDTAKLTLLLEAGADAGARDSDGQTSIEYAHGLLAESTSEQYQAEIRECIGMLEAARQLVPYALQPAPHGIVSAQLHRASRV